MPDIVKWNVPEEERYPKVDEDTIHHAYFDLYGGYKLDLVKLAEYAEQEIKRHPDELLLNREFMIDAIERWFGFDLDAAGLAIRQRLDEKENE